MQIFIIIFVAAFLVLGGLLAGLVVSDWSLGGSERNWRELALIELAAAGLSLLIALVALFLAFLAFDLPALGG